jgi:sugar lactone lactonase YvrE
MIESIEILPTTIEIYDDRMRALIRPNAALTKLADGAIHSEGQVYIPENDRYRGKRLNRPKDSVQIYPPDRTQIGKILVPETVANLTFGGRDRNCLFIAAGGSLYASDLNTQGLG